MHHTAPQRPTRRPATPLRQLSLWDSTSIIVGIILGAAIYRSSPTIAASVPSAGWLLGVWILGGVLSLLGALCYAELATTYPEEGGDYVYLNRAFGSGIGFLFAWSQLWVVRPGSIGAMAFVFAEYANAIWPQATGEQATLVLLLYAVLPIAVLTIINILGVREGKWTQNLLTTVKLLGLVAFMLVGLLYAEPVSTTAEVATAAPASSATNFGLAMILVLFAYGGWNEMAFVAAEVRDPARNILRALLLGTVAVAAIYLLVSLAFLHGLGFAGMRDPAAATQVLGLGLGDAAGRVFSLLLCVSALGAINGQIFTGSRIYYAMGRDHRLYTWLGRWHPRLGTPVPSLLIQMLITLGVVLGFGRVTGGFERMVNFTTPVFWTFLLLVGLGVVVLRYRQPQIPRPFRTPLLPMIAMIFCGSCGFMVYSSLTYAYQNNSWEARWAVAILLLGVGMLALNRRLERGLPASEAKRVPNDPRA